MAIRNKGFSAKSKGQFFYFRTNHNQCLNTFSIA